jgi:hypothetical protein
VGLVQPPEDPHAQCERHDVGQWARGSRSLASGIR